MHGRFVDVDVCSTVKICKFGALNRRLVLVGQTKSSQDSLLHQGQMTACFPLCWPMSCPAISLAVAAFTCLIASVEPFVPNGGSVLLRSGRIPGAVSLGVRRQTFVSRKQSLQGRGLALRAVFAEVCTLS